MFRLCDLDSADWPENRAQRGDGRNLCDRCGGGLIRGKADADGHDVAIAFAIPVRRRAHGRANWDPHVDFRRRVTAEAGGHDADNRALDAAKRQATADDVAIPGERRLPEGMTQYDDWRTRWATVVFGQQCAA